LSKGAIEGDVEKFDYERCVNEPDRMSRKDGLKVLENHGLKVLGLESGAKPHSLRMRRKLLAALTMNCVLLFLGVQLLVHLTCFAFCFSWARGMARARICHLM